MPQEEWVNYYPHHIGDYSRDTAHLSMLEDAAYRRMLDLYYAAEKPLPMNRQGIYRLVRAKSKAEQSAVDVILGEFFTESEQGWRNARADAEIIKAQEKSQSARDSAGKRWHSEGNAKAMRTHTEGNAPNNQKPITNNQQPKKTKDEEVAVLPPWLPKDEWKALLEVRKSKKAPNTPRALNLLLSELERLKSLGFDPAKVLDQSTLKGWKSVFPLKLDLVPVSAEPVGKLCDYCAKVSSGQVNGRRACEAHWTLAMDNTPTLKAVA